MAEAFVRHYAGDWLEPYSAGLEPKEVNPYTIRVMDEIGIDISDQRSKSVREYMGQESFHFLVTVCHHAEENCPTTFLGYSTKLHWPYDDPAQFSGTEEDTLAKFRAVRDVIHADLKTWLADIQQNDERITAWLAQHDAPDSAQ